MRGLEVGLDNAEAGDGVELEGIPVSIKLVLRDEDVAAGFCAGHGFAPWA